MDNSWLIISNACHVQIYSSDKVEKDMDINLTLIKELHHPESSLKRQELDSDKPGHYKSSPSRRGAYEQHSDAKELEKDKFAREISQLLKKAKLAKQFKDLILVMPAHFHGLLEPHLSKEVKDSIIKIIHKDYVDDSNHRQSLSKLIKSYFRQDKHHNE